MTYRYVCKAFQRECVFSTKDGICVRDGGSPSCRDAVSMVSTDSGATVSLKHCPFCGVSPYTQWFQGDSKYVLCHECESLGYRFLLTDTSVNNLVKRWNERCGV